MLQHYLKITSRSFVKNRLAALINICGLAIGLTAGMLIILLIKSEFEQDRFHKNIDHIYMLLANSRQEGNIRTGSSTPALLTGAMRNSIPEVNYAAHCSSNSQQLLTYGGKSIYEDGIYAEPDLLNIMHFPAVQGNPITTLGDVGSIVLTVSTAKKLFGDEDPIGKIIRHNNQHDLKVGAIMQDLPSNSSVNFHVALPFRIWEQENAGTFRNWDAYVLATYVELKPGANLTAVNKKINALFPTPPTDINTGIFVYPFKDRYLYSSFKNGKPNGGRIELVLLFAVIGVCILLVACINFMNLSTARSAMRSREVGVRKTLGATKKQVIVQFLGEALMMTTLALLIAVILAVLLLPSVNYFTGKNVTISLSDWKLWLLVTGMTILTGLIAGSYPAFFMSAFQPVRVLKGVITNKKSSSLLRKGLVTFQFIISIFLIITTIVIYRQQSYIQQLPIGYEQSNLIDIPARGDMSTKLGVMKNDLLQLPGVMAVSAGADDLVRFGGATDGISWPGKTADQNFYINVSDVAYDWVKTAGLQLLEGRDFNPAFGADSTGCILNAAAVKKMGLKDPVVGTKLGNNTIVGVVADFSFNDAFNAPGPLIVYLNHGPLSHLFVRLRNDADWQKRLTQIEQIVKKRNPDYPFEFHFTKDVYQRQFKGIRSTGQMVSLTGILAIFISCMGLFGLSAFLAERRNKEIGIRKVFGANVTKIWLMLSQDFLKPVLIAFLIAAPLAGFAMHLLLSSFDHHISLSWWIFVLAGILVLLVALFTVSYQGIKAALTNPVESLRAE
ncbi:ABC transporter permease [Chitinophaga ginsengisoli]|uniref:FtsX-like permease family protein n=1 Tax=Chitinophaga ginsengisoli TaxID=363837 RepID=A0A2P8FC23_9BACT|nr:ABC transporter permease [Chitinophaga ginsengisoli]PSL19275.1 FtsX-like permease family protein [Chitinophaga ginsengisoli]